MARQGIRCLFALLAFVRSEPPLHGPPFIRDEGRQPLVSTQRTPPLTAVFFTKEVNTFYLQGGARNKAKGTNRPLSSTDGV